MKKVKICKYRDAYLEGLREFNFLLYYKLQYQEEYESKDCLFAMNEKKEVLGVGCISYHGEVLEVKEETNSKGKELDDEKEEQNLKESISRIWQLDLITSDFEGNMDLIRDMLMEASISELKKKVRGLQKKDKKNQKTDSLRVFVKKENNNELNYYATQGFHKKSSTEVYSFDLSKELNSYEMLQDLQIDKLDVCGDDITEYRIATAISGNGILNSMMEDWFSDERETFSMYGIIKEGTLISNLTTWDRPDGTSVIENVFTVPEYRGKQMAKELIAYTLGMLKEKGRSEVWISSDIGNENAIKLYQNIGFEWKYSIFELAYGLA